MLMMPTVIMIAGGEREQGDAVEPLGLLVFLKDELEPVGRAAGQAPEVGTSGGTGGRSTNPTRLGRSGHGPRTRSAATSRIRYGQVPDVSGRDRDVDPSAGCSFDTSSIGVQFRSRDRLQLARFTGPRTWRAGSVVVRWGARRLRTARPLLAIASELNRSIRTGAGGDVPRAEPFRGRGPPRQRPG